jgi:hypothetical protein
MPNESLGGFVDSKKKKKKIEREKADPVFCDTGGGGKNRGVSDVGRYGFV